jgi:hypothetical protein
MKKQFNEGYDKQKGRPNKNKLESFRRAYTSAEYLSGINFLNPYITESSSKN